MIFIIGAGRSGTTLTTQVFEACGANLGGASGLAEHRQFKKQFLMWNLSARGFDPYGQNPIPEEPIRDMDPEQVREDVLRLLEGVDVVKDVKTVFFWPVLAEAFPEAHWVTVMRPVHAVARSCMTTHFMNAYNTHEDWVRWAQAYHNFCADIMMDLPKDKTHTIHSHWFTAEDGPDRLSSVVEACGLDWNPDAFSSVFDRNLWHE